MVLLVVMSTYGGRTKPFPWLEVVRRHQQDVQLDNLVKVRGSGLLARVGKTSDSWEIKSRQDSSKGSIRPVCTAVSESSFKPDPPRQDREVTLFTSLLQF